MSLNVGRFVPVRFLALISHFVILVTVLWSVNATVNSCLPTGYSQTDFETFKERLTIGFSLAIALIAIEMIGFLLGISMFVTSIALISTLAHVVASILLAMFVLDSWECQSYWYIFGFCSATPAFFELVALMLYGLGKRR
ncbi:transmembrane protein 107-like [Clytia hemisphaerica]